MNINNGSLSYTSDIISVLHISY